MAQVGRAPARVLLAASCAEMRANDARIQNAAAECPFPQTGQVVASPLSLRVRQLAIFQTPRDELLDDAGTCPMVVNAAAASAADLTRI